MSHAYTDAELTTLESNASTMEGLKVSLGSDWWSSPAGRAKASRSLANLAGNPPNNTSTDSQRQRYESIVSRVRKLI